MLKSDRDQGKAGAGEAANRGTSELGNRNRASGNRTLPPNALPIDMVNMPALLDRVGNDREFLRELFAIFEVEFPRLHTVMEMAISAKDLQLAATLAHHLKGMLINLSMERGAAAAGVIEARAGCEDQQGAEASLAAFDNEVAGLLPGLEACLADPNDEGRG